MSLRERGHQDFLMCVFLVPIAYMVQIQWSSEVPSRLRDNKLLSTETRIGRFLFKNQRPESYILQLAPLFRTMIHKKSTSDGSTA